MLYILMLNYQGKNKINKVKESILPCLENIEYKILIKDNGSTDGSLEEMQSWKHPNINVIDYKHNKDNYAMGMNFLFKEAFPKKNDDLVMTLNNDIIFKDKNSIKNMINIINKDKSVGLVGAKLNYTNNNKIQHVGVLFHSNGFPYHYRSGRTEEDKDKQDRVFPSVTGAISLTTADTYRSCFENSDGLVGMNQSYFWAFEDVDMTMRITHNLKKKIVCCGRVNILHEESGTLKQNPINKMFMAQNCRLFLEHWRNQIDLSLVNKYESDANFNLYKNK